MTFAICPVLNRCTIECWLRDKLCLVFSVFEFWVNFSWKWEFPNKSGEKKESWSEKKKVEGQKKEILNCGNLQMSSLAFGTIYVLLRPLFLSHNPIRDVLKTSPSDSTFIRQITGFRCQTTRRILASILFFLSYWYLCFKNVNVTFFESLANF